ncbi:uncharacterized protein LOC110435511 isoform X3 [Sorghum bicolor]|uniref:uncharacterized protein LOC110435511 isoform X3 n=1 Tax=Sorghum bicolor TaxID=4558 RepID=UPI00081AE3D1|nr:uncharacterized protein LOC110435511 isoform X3 [Sorghum bicolor]|eukprot:XP_021316801.1 uncharacterized protein LOC110435511 isoform X3 [Sorghum bicolor]
MPASKSSDSALRQVPKPAISSPPTGAKSSGSQASGSAPRQAPKAGDSAPRRRAKPATLPPPTGAKTKGLNQGDEEDDCFVVEEDGTLIYTRFCSKRAASLLNKKELCHICYFKHGRVNPFKKTEVDIYVRRKVVVSRHLQGKRPVDTTTSAMRNIGTGGSNA